MFVADGSTLQINTYQAAFAILGNRFGGDGSTTFKLPDLCNAAPSGLYYNICVTGLFPGIV